MEELLRRSMVGPVPKLGRDFERRLMRKLERQSKPMSRVGWMVLAGYGLVSTGTCVAVMLGERLDGWTTTGVVLSSILLTMGLLWGLQRIEAKLAR